MKRWWLGLVLLCLWLCGNSTAVVQAEPGQATPIPVTGITPEQSPTSMPLPTATGTSTATPHPTATALPRPIADRKVHQHARVHRVKPVVRPSATPMPPPTTAPTAPPARKRTGSHKHKKRRHSTKAASVTPTATSTATPVPTATPPVTLQTEDSIKPVACNGPSKPLAKHPFLIAPFSGWTSLVSYFDHDQPNFAHDGQVIIATGASATPDAAHRTTDFPAYWSSDLRQYLYYDGHNGYDYNISYRPVYAAASGKVLFAAYEYSFAHHLGYGKMVMINHGHGYVTLYGHFSTLLVHRGQRVKRGQTIGISGNTGHSTGPHLHFTVFHNCTPSDPYGWYGSGQDPLYGYMGEESMYLWLVPPRITNPPPNWPGIRAIPPVAATRLLLLRLPASRNGTPDFTKALNRELESARQALALRGISSRIDAFAGALKVRGAISPAALYAVQHVASIGAPDVAADARVDVLAALGRAALVTPHRRIAIDRSPSWSGYLLQWQGRTFLVGRGRKGKAVSLRLTGGAKRTSTRLVEADSLTGSYALDLGVLSRPQIHAITNQLRGSVGHRVTVADRVVRVKVSARARAKSTSQTDVRSEVALGLGAALILLFVVFMVSPFRGAVLPSRSGSSDVTESDGER